MEAWASFRELYLRWDRRVLGAFRIALSLVLLYDVTRRFPDAGLLWSSDGVLGAEALRKMPQAKPQISFLLSLSSASSVQLAFVALGVVFALYGAGLFTRAMQVLALLGYASLNARNIFFEDGGTGCTILLLCWTLFAPLGDRFSVDALLRDARAPTVAARVRARAEARAPYYSLALFAILLQASVIYWLNAAHKSGGTWRSGDAVHLVLWQHRVNTPLALWFSSFEPSWFSPLTTWLTRRTEFVLPLLLLWPTHARLTRPIAFLLAVLLHLGIALMLTLGPFSYSMICLLWLVVPGTAVDAALSKLPERPWRRAARARAELVRFLGRLPRCGWRARLSSLQRARLGQLREVAIACMLVVETANVVNSNRAFPSALKFREPAWLLAYKPYVRGWQGWSMFAPNAPEEDGTMVLDGLTSSGRHWDPFTGAPPDFEQIRSGLAPHSIALSDYFFAMRGKGEARYRKELTRYLKTYRIPGTEERLRSVDVYWVKYVPPKRGSYVPGPITREKLWRTKVQ